MEELPELLGRLYDITNKIYVENVGASVKDANADTSNDAARMTAILNSINKHVKFLEDKKD